VIRSFKKDLFSSVIIFVGVYFFLKISLNVSVHPLGLIQWDRSGDGLKNYYTFAYHLKYLNSINFNGLLYPFGDLTTYTDSQYPLVLIAKGLYSLGLEKWIEPLLIINASTVLSIFLGGFLMFKIFSEIDNGSSEFVLLSIIGICMSPQILRIQSHYGLTYSVFFLLILYLSLTLTKSKGWLTYVCYYFLLSLLLLLSGFVHAYHLIYSGLFISVFGVFSFVRKSNFGSVVLLLSTISSLLFFLLIFQIFDQADDRPLNPYGLKEYRTKLQHLLPAHGGFGELLNNRFIPHKLVEGYVYPTLLPIIVLIIAIGQKVWGLKSKIKCEFLRPHEIDLLLSGFFCLLIAMGVHLYFGDFIFEFFPQVKQFRALGRFSWPFYYVTFIISGIYLVRVLKTMHRTNNRHALFGVLSLVLILDTFSFHKDFGKLINTYKAQDLLKNEMSIESILGDTISPARFQALLPLPISTEGAEKFNLKADYFLKTRCLPFSYQQGIPMCYAIMSRVSKEKMFKLLQLSNSIYGQKKIVASDFPSSKPLLIVIPNTSELIYQDILERASFIGKDEKISLYEIGLNDVLARSKYISNEPHINLNVKNSINSLDTLLLFNNFNSSPEYLGIDKKPGCYFQKQGNEVLVEFELPINRNYSTVEISFWNKILSDKSNVPSFTVSFLDKTGNTLKKDNFRDWDLKRTEVYDDWVRYKRIYKLNEKLQTISVKVDGEFQFIDNLLIKSPDINVLESISSKEAFANHMMVEM
jgi:hypothetical protein